MTTIKNGGKNTMKTKFYLNGKKTTQKAVKEITGDKRFKEITADAKEAFLEDPYTELSYMVQDGILTVEFV